MGRGAPSSSGELQFLMTSKWITLLSGPGGWWLAAVSFAPSYQFQYLVVVLASWNLGQNLALLCGFPVDDVFDIALGG